MKQEEKEILLKTFCSLLLYNGYFSYCNKIIWLKTIELDGKDTINNKYPVEICYPYLRPMSSMTEKEYIEYRTIQGRNCDYGEATICVSKDFYLGIFYDGNDTIKINVYYPNPVIQDWLNAHHFDYRGLIERGLALEAPEGMYIIK